jgi:hypothetical protein
MNYDFLTSLPWRLGSLAGLIVGGIAIAYGVTDYVVILLRIGLAFGAFFFIGSISAFLLKSVAGVYSISRPGKIKGAKTKLQMTDSEMDDDSQQELKAA